MTNHSFCSPRRPASGERDLRDVPRAAPDTVVRDHPAPSVRDGIVTAAFDLFWDRGYDDVTIVDIAKQAHIAVDTFHLYFCSKADMALDQNKLWLSEFVDAMASRPECESPDEMVPAALADLAERGREAGWPLRTVLVGLLLGDSSEEIAGRIFQNMAETEWALAALFGRRLGYAACDMEPLIIAAATMAGYRVSIYGYLRMLAAGMHPPCSEEMGRRCHTALTEGVKTLWLQPTSNSRLPTARARRSGAG